MKLTEESMRAEAKRALEIAAGGVRSNTCDAVANEFAYTVEKQLQAEGYDVVLPNETRAPVDGRKHFVAVVPGRFVASVEDEKYVVVDATIKQFDELFEEDLPNIAVLYPNDERRKRWYDYIRFPKK